MRGKWRLRHWRYGLLDEPYLSVIDSMGLCCSYCSEIRFSPPRTNPGKRPIPWISKSFPELHYEEPGTPRFPSRRSTVRHEAEDLSDLLLCEGNETPKFAEGEAWDQITETQGEDQRTRKSSWVEGSDNESLRGF